MSKVVVAIDPGRAKCGFAVVSLSGDVVHKAIVDVNDMGTVVRTWAEDETYEVAAFAVGDRTGTNNIVEQLTAVGVPVDRIYKVDEHRSSEIGRRRYWQENRPRGWRRLVPVSLQTPPEPYDDYVAVELAYRYLAGADLK